MRIRMRPIRFIPKQIDPYDLHGNGKLYSETMIETICNASLKNGYVRFLDPDDKEIKLKFAVIKMDDDYYAIYKGNKSLGSGAYGRVKLVQNLKTGMWLALKIQPIDSLIMSTNKKKSIELQSLKKMDAIVRTGPKQQPVHFERYSESKLTTQDYLLMHYVSGETLDHFQGKNN